MPDAESLMRHAGFLRGVARAMLRDEHAADDLVQETFLTALERPPRSAHNLRGWLATVARNLARMRLRGGARRDARERAVAAAAPAPGTDVTAARLEVQRRLVEAVERLPEPLRSTVVHRFHDEMKPAEVARALGVTTKTVRLRLLQAMELLRADLDERRRGWRGVLLPFAAAGLSRTAKAAALGGVLVSTKIKFAAVALMLATAAFLFWNVARENDSRPERRSEADRRSGSSPVETARSVATPDIDDAPVAATPAGGWRLVGRVLGANGPLPGASVAVELRRGQVRDRIATVQTDDEGRYVASLAPLRALPPVARAVGKLSARASAAGHRPGAWTDASATLPLGAAADAVIELQLRLAPGATLRGRVVAADGTPAGDASVRLKSENAEDRTVTDADGRYLLGVGADGTHRLSAEADGQGTAAATLELLRTADAEAPDLLIEGPWTIAGIVVDRSGRPLSDLALAAQANESATPGLDYATTRTDASGRFRLSGLHGGGYRLSLPTKLAPKAIFEATAGEVDARLVVDLVRVRIRIRDEAGNALPGIFLGKRGWAASEPMTAWFEGRLAEPPERLQHANTHAAGFVTAPDATESFLAPAGTIWTFETTTRGTTTTETVLITPEDRGFVDVDLVVAPAAGVGTLTLELETDTGERVDGYAALLLSAKTRMTRLAWDRPAGYPGASPPAPAGEYRLVVEPGPTVGSHYRHLEVPVTVRAGATTPVRLRVEAGARFRFRMTAPGVDAGTALGGPTLRLRSADGARDVSAAWFERPKESGFEIGSSIEAGTVYYAWNVLDPGVYELTAELKGYAPLRKSIRLEAGAPETIELLLERRR